jgi:hypothetical protein
MANQIYHSATCAALHISPYYVLTRYLFEPTMNTRFYTFAAIICASALSRLLPHPPNFAPLTAMSLFAGAYVVDKRFAFALPLTAMFLSDIVLELTTGWGFYSGMWTVYGALALVTLIGFRLKNNVSVGSVAGYSFAGALLFFIVTNFAVWALGSMYPHSARGLAMCYTAAFPFFQNSLLGDAVYAVILFGGFAFAEHFLPRLQENKTLIS